MICTRLCYTTHREKEWFLFQKTQQRRVEMNKLMALIAIVLGLVLVAYQATAATIQSTTPSEVVSITNDWATTTANGAKLSEEISGESEVLLVASNWVDSRLGREFRIRSGISCRAWNYTQPTFADELSKHFSSEHQRKINQLRKSEARWVPLCKQLPSVKTKKQARSWLRTREKIAREAASNNEYWTKNPRRWSDTEEARIWHAFLCREGVRGMERIAQVTAEVISENKPRSAAPAKKKAQSIKARVSNLCSREYDGVEKKFISASKGVWNSYLSLWRLG